MGRLAWSQLRSRPGRTVALMVGIALATSAFTMLTAAARTAQLRTSGTVSAHFRAAYDILVRPKGSRTRLEGATGVVQPDFLSGLYGGISLAQYRQIQRIPGVQVAAPIAMVGYGLLRVLVPVRLPPANYHLPGRQLFRYTTTWVSDGGAVRITQPPSYLYLTPHRLVLLSSGTSAEELSKGRRVAVCPATGYSPHKNPFGPDAQSSGWCWSRINGTAGSFVGGPRVGAFVTADWALPVLIAAIDPIAEARLDRLNHAVTSGSYLPEIAGVGRTSNGQLTFPVLASTDSGIGEYAVTRIERMAPPRQPVVLSARTMASYASRPGRAIGVATTTSQQAYRQALAVGLGGQPIRAYWSAGAVRYSRDGGGPLIAVPVRNPQSEWRSLFRMTSLLAPPMDESGTQYRALRAHIPGGLYIASPEVRLVGTFAPGRIPAFDPLSRVPLGAYQPIVAVPRDAATRRALGGDLRPSLNLGGLVSQPVNLITTLAALPALENTSHYHGGRAAGAPISVIRVRVAGVTGPNPVSVARIKVVAQQIAVDTGLQVDIVAGSSPAPTRIDLLAGRFGQPRLRLSEAWVKKGVAVRLLSAVDDKSLVLSGLILLVCVLFVANSAAAAVRGRRQELGVLACLGWTRPRRFMTALTEVAGIGLIAGGIGAVAALSLSAALGLHASAWRALLAVPLALAVAVVAGAVPAWLAARAEPVAAVRPAVLEVRRGRHPRGITGLAVANVTRAPGRTLSAALGLAAGVAALTLLSAVTYAFQGVVVGSLLGNAVAVQVRGIDFIAVAATVALGVLTVADVVFLNVRERATELAAIRSFGWRESALARLVVTEGALVGALGSMTGAALALIAMAWFASQLPVRGVITAVAAGAAGIVVTIVATLLPAQVVRRMPAAQLLAAE